MPNWSGSANILDKFNYFYNKDAHALNVFLILSKDMCIICSIAYKIKQ